MDTYSIFHTQQPACDHAGTFAFYDCRGKLQAKLELASFADAERIAYKIGCTVERIGA